MKKTIAIITVAFLALLVAVTIILAVIPKNFYDPINNYSNLSYIRVYKGDGTCQDYYKTSSDSEDKEIYAKLLELHEESLKENILVSMFQGALSFNGGIETEAFTSDTLKDQLAKGCYIEFSYNADFEQPLKYDGKDFRNGEGDLVEYTKMIIEVNSSNYMEECRAFVLNGEKASSYNVRFLAHQSELYKYVQSLELLNTVVTD